MKISQIVDIGEKSLTQLDKFSKQNIAITHKSTSSCLDKTYFSRDNQPLVDYIVLIISILNAIIYKVNNKKEGIENGKYICR